MTPTSPAAGTADDGHHPAREPTQPDLPELCPLDRPVITSESQPTEASDRRRVVIHAACTCRGVANGFTNVVVSKRDGQIEFDPHVNGSCKLTLAGDEAIALRDALIEWLG